MGEQGGPSLAPLSGWQPTVFQTSSHAPFPKNYKRLSQFLKTLGRLSNDKKQQQTKNHQTITSNYFRVQTEFIRFVSPCHFLQEHHNTKEKKK